MVVQPIEVSGSRLDPGLAEFEQVLVKHFGQVIGLEASQRDECLGGSVSVNLNERLNAWQEKSPFEVYCQKLDLDVTPLWNKVLRENPTPAFNPGLLGHSPMDVFMPLLCAPLLPVAFRPGEVTVVSWVPGLGHLLQHRSAYVLNAFWEVRRITALWCEPAHLREVLRLLGRRIKVRPDAGKRAPEADNGGIPWVDLDCVSPNDKTNQWFSPLLQRKYGAAPLYLGKRVLTLGVPKLLDARIKAEIEGSLRHRYTVQQVLVDDAALQRFITASESRAINTSGIVRSMLNHERSNVLGAENTLEVIHADHLQPSSTQSRDGEQAVIRFVHSIIYKAVDMAASDIMFQEFPERLRVRYKVDGDWFDESGDFPGHVAKQVISRVKVISGLEIQYVRLPQDGTFPIRIGDQRYDFRVNTSYQAQGQQAVLRLQRDQRHVRTLAELGMPGRHIQAVSDIMNGDHGLLILCGPTGSGKSTTIYSILRSVDPIKNNILTAESPIEVRLDHVSQTQVDEDGPYTYAAWARGILRQAPDVVMMGEIRDEASVEALMRLSSSGHRAISTLHTNSACEAPNRFFLFRAQPFMVADSLKLALSQRLVKKVCPRCYEEVKLPSDERLARLGVEPDWLGRTPTLRRGRGCDFCRRSGVSGRKAIFEALIIDDEARAAIQDQAPALHFRRLMQARGEASLFEQAVREAAAGVISLDEACKFREVTHTSERR
ncbi:MAG TPA: ATPase, T2SS/T4P/T4SS family [Chthoniobacterales bacterium]